MWECMLVRLSVHRWLSHNYFAMNWPRLTKFSMRVTEQGVGKVLEQIPCPGRTHSDLHFLHFDIHINRVRNSCANSHKHMGKSQDSCAIPFASSMNISTNNFGEASSNCMHKCWQMDHIMCTIKWFKNTFFDIQIKECFFLMYMYVSSILTGTSAQILMICIRNLLYNIIYQSTSHSYSNCFERNTQAELHTFITFFKVFAYLMSHDLKI